MPINSYENYVLSWRPVKERLTRPYYQSLVQQLKRISYLVRFKKCEIAFAKRIS